MGKAPRMGCRLPSKESSPMMMYLSTSSDWICEEATKIPKESSDVKNSELTQIDRKISKKINAIKFIV